MDDYTHWTPESYAAATRDLYDQMLASMIPNPERRWWQFWKPKKVLPTYKPTITRLTSP